MRYLEWLPYGLYVLLGPGTWALFLFAMVKGRKRMRILVRPAPKIPDPPPSVSVLIPAKDEAGQIEKCIRSVLNQDYPNFNVIVIDDRSTDGTGRILDDMAAQDARLIVVHLKDGSLPRGWGGKSFALHNGLLQATSDWLLFVDADVLLEPDVMGATIAWAMARKFDLISILPRFVSGTLAEGVFQPLAGAATSAMFAIPLTNSPEWPRTAFANGQYLMVRRSVYEAVGGHEAIRGTLSEDVAIARRLKIAGYRPRLGWGDTWATVRMYEGFNAIFQGWSRNFYVGSLGKPWRILGLIAFIFFCCWSLLAAIGWGLYGNAPHPAGWMWLGAAAAHYLLITVTAALMYFWAYEPVWYALLFPISVAFLVVVSLKSLWICATGKVTWRGTQYSAEQLAGNSPSETDTHGNPQRTT